MIEFVWKRNMYFFPTTNGENPVHTIRMKIKLTLYVQRMFLFETLCIDAIVNKLFILKNDLPSKSLRSHSITFVVTWTVVGEGDSRTHNCLPSALRVNSQHNPIHWLWKGPLLHLYRPSDSCFAPDEEWLGVRAVNLCFSITFVLELAFLISSYVIYHNSRRDNDVLWYTFLGNIKKVKI